MTGTPPPVPGYGSDPGTGNSSGSSPSGSGPSGASFTGAAAPTGDGGDETSVLKSAPSAKTVSDAGKAAAKAETNYAKYSKTAEARAVAAGGSSTGSNANGQSSSTTNTSGTATSTSSSSLATKTQTNYTSYLDPASVQGAQADAWFRLLGRNPTSAEYQAFMQTVYGYENQANSGTFSSGIILKTGQKYDSSTGHVVDEKTGKPVAESDIIRGQSSDSSSSGTSDTVTNTVDQRGLNQRGLQFLAGQAAMQNPEEGTYQAATTYFNAFMKALTGPAAGMQASGPTVQAP